MVIWWFQNFRTKQNHLDGLIRTARRAPRLDFLIPKAWGGLRMLISNKFLGNARICFCDPLTVLGLDSETLYRVFNSP